MRDVDRAKPLMALGVRQSSDIKQNDTHIFEQGQRYIKKLSETCRCLYRNLLSRQGLQTKLHNIKLAATIRDPFHIALAFLSAGPDISIST